MCVGESVSKSSYRTVELEACWLDKECALLKGKLRGLTEKLCDPLQLSGTDSIVYCVRNGPHLFMCNHNLSGKLRVFISC